MAFTAQDYKDSVERIKAVYQLEKTDHLPRREFYIWDEALERWADEGMPRDVPQEILFNFDPHPYLNPSELGVQLGWCAPPFLPEYEEKVLEEDGDYQICRDTAGRIVRYFKDRRHGFMPTYLQHPIKTEEDWERDVKPRLDAADERRYASLGSPETAEAAAMVARGERLISGRAIGGYMYLRALFGPEDIMYAFFDRPELIRRVMEVWRDLVFTGLSRLQDAVGPLFELFLAEDICYNHGPLISPGLIKEFILPYYREVYQALALRQSPQLHFQIDTDGFADPVIALYREVGVDAFSPFEVAAGSDVIRTAQEFPGMYISGGIDKRLLAEGPQAIERELQRIIPFFLERGGYIPTCDHGVPDNVSYENYLYYRRRICELDH